MNRTAEHTQPTTDSHLVIQPSILYAGNPIALITTLNRDGKTNISPMSSTWELGDRLVLGMTTASQGYENLKRERECVVNFPSSTIWPQVEQLARTTGRNPVPEHKQAIGYYFEPDKFACADFTPLEAEDVKPLRIAECPLQFEARLLALHDATTLSQEEQAGFGIFEMQVTRVHAHPDIVLPGTNHINTTAWKPLLYVFRHYFGTGPDLGRTFKAEAWTSPGRKAPVFLPPFARRAIFLYNSQQRAFAYYHRKMEGHS